MEHNFHFIFCELFAAAAAAAAAAVFGTVIFLLTSIYASL